MIQKIQYLRKLLSIGMPYSSLNASPATINNTLAGINDVNNNTVTPGTIVNPGTIVTGSGAISGIPPAILNVSSIAPISEDLIFNSINDLNDTSNEPLVHSRDNGGNIILLNDTNTTNQLLTIESISYKVPSTAVNSVIDTQFNYFKFPPRLSNIEVVDEINLNDAIDDIDLLSTRYTPGLTSGRQTGLGRETLLRAGRMIIGSIDDDLVNQFPYGYYDTDWRVESLLNMETVLGGVEQLKPSKFIITPDLIDAGENIFFRIRVDITMKGDNTTFDNYNRFMARLNKITGNTGRFSRVMQVGTYDPLIYNNPAGGIRLDTQLVSAISAVRGDVFTYQTLLKEYDNMLATLGDRTTTQQRLTLSNLKTRVDAAKLRYDNSAQRVLNAQTVLNDRLEPQYPGLGRPLPAGYRNIIYQMTYLVDMRTATPYDEYWITTACDTKDNEISKSTTSWQIVPQSKIRTAYGQ